jgi:hypothetical protein
MKDAFWFVTLALLLFISGCFLDRAGTGPITDCEDTNITIQPRYLCQGEDIHVEWETINKNARNCPTCRASLGEVNVRVTNSVDPTLNTTSEGLTGHQDIRVPDDFARGGAIIVTIDREGYVPELETNGSYRCMASESVWILPEGGRRTYKDSLEWCCACVGGQSGYEILYYERGEITSDLVQITEIYNANDFPIRVQVSGRLDLSGRPDNVGPRLLSARARTSDFNGQLSGNWNISTDPPPPLIECEGVPPGSTSEDVLVPPDGYIIPPKIAVEFDLICTR